MLESARFSSDAESERMVRNVRGVHMRIIVHSWSMIALCFSFLAIIRRMLGTMGRMVCVDEIRRVFVVNAPQPARDSAATAPPTDNTYTWPECA